MVQKLVLTASILCTLLFGNEALADPSCQANGQIVSAGGYSCQTNIRMVCTVSNGSGVWIAVNPPQQCDGPASKKLQILQATYGYQARTCDATTAVANDCNGKSSCTHTYSNPCGGDPAYGYTKHTDVSYKCTDGVTLSQSFSAAFTDGQVGVLSCE